MCYSEHPLLLKQQILLCLSRTQEFLSIQISLSLFDLVLHTILFNHSANQLLSPTLPPFPQKEEAFNVKQRPSVRAPQSCSYKHNVLICHLVTKTCPMKTSTNPVSLEGSTMFTYVLIIVLSHTYFCSIYPIIKQPEIFISLTA